MNKRFKIASLGMMCLVLISALFIISACDNGDELSTDQMTDTGITVKAFGPSPALRGGEIRFVGTNVDRATGVIIPGVPEITEFTKKEKTEIRVIVPQNAQEGNVILRTPQGDITPQTRLTFLEPIVIESITTAKVKTGSDFEIQGDYLNLIAKVVFQENVAVDSADFVSQSREKIVVKVPLKARSGEIMIANGAEIPVEVYSGELVADIVEPAITAVAPAEVKAGSKITITGNDFDLVEKIVFGGEKTVTGFTVDEAKKVITVTTPADAQDGAVIVVAYSGAEVVSETVLTMKMPTVSIEEKKVKNGETITVMGTDLDLVTGVWFDELEAQFTYANNALSVTVPETAASDHIRFVTASEKELSVTGITYVTPAISSIAPLSITAGDNITITGTNLDLVREVIFMSGEETASVNFQTAPEANSITIASPFIATNGTIDLKTVNGTVVTSSQSLNIEPALLAVITKMPEAVKPGALLTVEGINLNTVTKVEFHYTGGAVVPATSFLPNVDGTSLQMYAPVTLGKVNLILTNPVGASVPYYLSIGLTDPVADPSLIIFDFEDVGDNNVLNNACDWGGICGVKGGDESGYFFEVMPTSTNITGYWYIADNWVEAPYPSVSGIGDYVLKMDIRLKNDIPVPTGWHVLNIRIAGNVEYNIMPYVQEGSVYTTGGEWRTITIPLTDIPGLSDPTSTGGDWGLIYNKDASVPFPTIGLCIDNIRYELK
jgi:IPT/TIG domain.